MLEKTLVNLKSWGSLRWVSPRQGVFSNPSKIPSLWSLSLWSATTTTMVHFSQILHKLPHTGPSKELNKTSHPDTAGTNNHQGWFFGRWNSWLTTQPRTPIRLCIHLRHLRHILSGPRQAVALRSLVTFLMRQKNSQASIPALKWIQVFQLM